MKINICIIGAGNISNTRHIPAVLKNKDLVLYGVISNDQNRIDQTISKYNINHSFLLDKAKDVEEQLKNCDWFSNVDAVIIGTPPQKHYLLVKACLNHLKHVLVEKPMMMNTDECDEVIELAKRYQLILNVMHTFQFSDGMIELEKRYQSGEFGKIESILELQLTNRRRRLPAWYNELPLGLFYDEAAHFFYSALKFGDGGIEVINASAQFNDKSENTPKFLQAQLKAGAVPVQMYMNFNSPICEWGFLLICDRKIAIYDFFKDILIVLDNDELHLAQNVIKLSLQFSVRFWLGFIKSGLKMVSGKLLYGHDKVIAAFAHAICTGVNDNRIDAANGRMVVNAMNKVVSLAYKENDHERTSEL